MNEYMNGPGEHQDERMFFRAVEIFAALSFLSWFAKKAFRNIGSFLVFLAFMFVAVWSCYLIPRDNWLFYPILLIAVFFLIRVMRRQ